MAGFERAEDAPVVGVVGNGDDLPSVRDGESDPRGLSIEERGGLPELADEHEAPGAVEEVVGRVDELQHEP
jgi:hypothetical protein